MYIYKKKTEKKPNIVKSLVHVERSFTYYIKHATTHAS